MSLHEGYTTRPPRPEPCPMSPSGQRRPGGQAWAAGTGSPRARLDLLEAAALAWRGDASHPSSGRIGRMARTDRAARTIAAPPGAVRGALLDADALGSWLPPDGMHGRVDRLDARAGGGFRMELTYLDPAGAPGKSTDATDVVEVRFGELTEERVVWRTEFVADDPAFAGVMTMTWSFRPVGAGSEVVVTADDVPPGIEQGVHEAAMASSLAHLAAFVEG